MPLILNIYIPEEGWGYSLRHVDSDNYCCEKYEYDTQENKNRVGRAFHTISYFRGKGTGIVHLGDIHAYCSGGSG